MSKRLNYSQNLLKWRVGCFNIDACRVGNDKLGGGTVPSYRDIAKKSISNGGEDKLCYGNVNGAERIKQEEYTGRFPANLILEAGEPCRLMNEQAPKCGDVMNTTRKVDTSGGSGDVYDYSKKKKGVSSGKGDGLGGASRFFIQIESEPNE